MNRFKERLKELRNGENLKQSQVSAEIGVPEATYSNWEQGRAEPDIDRLIILARFFRVSVDVLVGIAD